MSTEHSKSGVGEVIAMAIGGLLFLGGIAAAYSSMRSSATVGETYNIGLLNDRTNGVIFNCALAICGLMIVNISKPQRHIFIGFFVIIASILVTAFFIITVVGIFSKSNRNEESKASAAVAEEGRRVADAQVKAAEAEQRKAYEEERERKRIEDEKLRRERAAGLFKAGDMVEVVIEGFGVTDGGLKLNVGDRFVVAAMDGDYIVARPSGKDVRIKRSLVRFVQTAAK